MQMSFSVQDRLGSFPLTKPCLLCSERVAEAMRACPRRSFLPANQQRDAYVDAPVRLEEFDFNVSAPHMHATCLEALDLRPGLRC